MNFQIIIPNSISEDISSVDVCIEQINGELNEGVDVTIRTSQIGSTATGRCTYTCAFLHVIFMLYVGISGDACIFTV